jgi:hypothetical protein
MSVIEKEMRGVELNVEGLLKLLGGTPEQRERFWEIFKGITSLADARLIEGSLTAAEHHLQGLHASLASLHGAAEEIRAGD